MSAIEKDAAVGSPLDRARARQRALKKDSSYDIDMPGWDGDLVLRVGVPNDEGGVATVRTLVALATKEVESNADDMADAIASAVIGLYSRTDGELEPIEVDGTILRFDHRYGSAMEIPECTTPRGAVFAAFTQGEPPRLNTARMFTVCVAAGAWLQGETVVQEKTVSGR